MDLSAFPEEWVHKAKNWLAKDEIHQATEEDDSAGLDEI